MKETTILENILKKSIKRNVKINQTISENVRTLVKHIGSNKSLVSALVTSCLKKIIEPSQDIRLHRTDFKGGYSARSLDTNVTVPFFKLHFPKYANKESAFLTLATREKIKWTIKEGEGLKIRNKKVKSAFLLLLDLVENKGKSEECLLSIFKELTLLSEKETLIFDETITALDFSNILNINKVIDMLMEHFSVKLSSRLPVIAIYTIYQELIKNVKRYNGKILKPLNVHTSADKHGYGDIEIWNKNNTPFEMLEIKHNIAIDRNLIFDVVKKSKNTTIKRYYILTTFTNSFLSKKEEVYINKFILKIKQDFDIDVIANGIIPSLKYYLRFIDDYKAFIKSYTKNLIVDAKKSTEIKDFHLTTWQEILKKNNMDK